MAEIIDPQEQGEADPQRMQAELQQAQGMAQETGQKLQQAVQLIQTKQIEGQSRERIAKAQIDSKERIIKAQLDSDDYNRAMDRETKLAVAELGAKVDRLTLFLEERARLGVQQHDDDLAHRDQAHEVALEAQQAAHAREVAATAHQQQLEAGDVAHQQDLEAGEQGQAHALEQQEQAAALVPEPTEGE
jgi:hypothetical protein